MIARPILRGNLGVDAQRRPAAGDHDVPSRRLEQLCRQPLCCRVRRLIFGAVNVNVHRGPRAISMHPPDRKLTRGCKRHDIRNTH